MLVLDSLWLPWYVIEAVLLNLSEFLEIEFIFEFYTIGTPKFLQSTLKILLKQLFRSKIIRHTVKTAERSWITLFIQ